jgi:hypothetical protein
LERQLADRYYRSLVGRHLDVLVEGPAPRLPGLVTGTACRYVPVVFEGYMPAVLGRCVPVVAESVADGVLRARPLPAPGLLPNPGGEEGRIPLALASPA